MTAPGYTGYQVARDPTAVIGARIGAYFIDALLALALLLVLAPTPVNPWAEYVEVPDGMEYGDACDELGRSDDVDMCYELGDRAYFTDGPVVVAQSVVPLVYSVLVLVVLQGLTGFTLGKVLFGIRTVREDGQVPGILRAFLRTILWVVDGQPCGIPLVGLITGLSTKGHRRVGDMVAKTFVVNKADAGRPVVVPGMTEGYGAQGGYQAPGGYGAPGYGAPGYGAPGYGAPTAYPGPGGYPSAPPGGAWGATPPTAPPADSSTTPWGASPPTETAPSASAAEQAAGIAAPQPPPDSGDPYSRGFGAGAGLGGAEGGPSGETPATAATDTSATAPGSTRESTEPSGGLSPEPAESAVPTGSAVPTDSAVPTESSVPGLSSEPAAEGTAGPGGDQGQEVPDESDTASESPAVAPAEPTAPTEQQPEAQQEAPTYNPQWDAARGTYIQWDPNRGRWLAWDDNAKQWHVI